MSVTVVRGESKKDGRKTERGGKSKEGAAVRRREERRAYGSIGARRVDAGCVVRNQN